MVLGHKTVVAVAVAQERAAIAEPGLQLLQAKAVEVETSLQCLVLLTVKLVGLLVVAVDTLDISELSQLVDRAEAAQVADTLVVAEHQDLMVLQTLAEAAVPHGALTVDQNKLV
jgi:hypothetical protein